MWGLKQVLGEACLEVGLEVGGSLGKGRLLES